MQEKIASCKRFRELTEEWVDVVVALETVEREAAKRARRRLDDRFPACHGTAERRRDCDTEPVIKHAGG